MRSWVLASLIMVGTPAAAQPVVDGKAKTDATVAPFVEAYVADLPYPSAGKSTLRSIMTAIVTKGASADDQDLLRELASGQAFDVEIDGRTLRVPAARDDVVAIARLMAAPPNLNTLWKQAGEPTLQLIEISRWGEPANQRIVQFMANKLHAAWVPSTTNNAYKPWMDEIGGISGALDRIDDPAVRKEGKLLLKAAIEEIYARSKTDGTTPPAQYLLPSGLNEVGYPELR